VKITQSLEIGRVFKTEHKGLKITINVRKGGNSLKCFISTDEFILGKYDLTSQHSLKLGYDRFKKNYANSNKYFKGEEEFIDFFLRVGEKLTTEEYEREGKTQTRELTKEALEFLKSPNLVDRMDYLERNTTEDPLVHCHDDLLIFNLVIISCRTTKPITLEFTGPSGSGKTYPANHAVNGFPKEMIIAPTGDTKNASKYDWEYYDQKNREYIVKTGDKCVFFREKQDCIEAVKFFKPMMSHDDSRLIYRVPMKDPVTGEVRTVKYVMDGIASFILLSVKHMDDEEMASRTMKGSPKSSKQKTSDVIDKTFESDGFHRIWTPPKELEVMKDAMFNLQRYPTINIFTKFISKIFPKDDMRRARDMNRLRGLIRSSTVLHQYQRCKENIDGKDVLYSSLEDNIIALLILDRMLESTVLGIPALTLKIYEIMKKMDLEEIDLTPNNIHEHCEISNIHQTMTTLDEVHLRTLENHRFVKLKKYATKSSEKMYSINKRYENITKVPKLTPLFIKEIQKSFRDIMINYEEVLPNIIVPDVVSPKNYPKSLDDDAVTGPALKHLLGFHYFDKDISTNSLKKMTPKNVRNILYNDLHIIEQPELKDLENEEMEENREKAVKEIKSGKSAVEWKMLSEKEADGLYQEYVEEQEEKMRDFMT
jgi:hypothetical protein